LTGSLEVITGSMFSGKTDELIRRLRRATIARQKVQVFKPFVDDRDPSGMVTSHAGGQFEAISIKTAEAIPHAVSGDTAVVAIDEAQFFDEMILKVCRDMADEGRRVIVAGLDTDFRGNPFGSMPWLMATAERVDKLHAICMVCGKPATRTQRLIDNAPARASDPVIAVGAGELYEARCREHHQVPE